MKIKYAVTFEFDLRAPLTHRGTIEAAEVHTCVSRAIRDARKALRPQSWTSMVVVVLERDLSGEIEEPEVGDAEAVSA